MPEEFNLALVTLTIHLQRIVSQRATVTTEEEHRENGPERHLECEVKPACSTPFQQKFIPPESNQSPADPGK